MKKSFRLILAMMFLATTVSTKAQEVFNSTIDSDAEFAKYTVIDANSDGSTWNLDWFMNAPVDKRDFDADDWFITPAIAMTAGSSYTIEFVSNTDYADIEEIIDLHVGKDATVSGMGTAVEKFAVKTDTKTTMSATFNATQTGNMYVGFHHCTTGEKYSENVYIYSIKVTEQAAATAVPVKVSGLKVTPATTGELKATVEFTTPSLAADGTTLTELTKIDVKRDGEVIKTFANPTTGATMSFEDTGMTIGNHTYSVVAANSVGEGEAETTQVFIGEDLPGQVTNLRFVYDYETKTSTLTWDAPTTGANGGVINPDNLTYEIRRANADAPEVTGLSELTYSEELTIDYLYEAEERQRQKYEAEGRNVLVRFVVDGQGTMNYYVKAVNAAGSGNEVKTNPVIIGEQNVIPYAESFADGRLTHYWRLSETTGRSFFLNVEDFRYSQDGDDGYLSYTIMDDQPTIAMAHTGMISMKDATNPVISFHYFTATPFEKPLKVKVAKNTLNFEDIAEVDLAEDISAIENWTKVIIPLTGCAGEEHVYVGLEIFSQSSGDLFYIDNVKIYDQKDNDLAVVETTLPPALKVDEQRNLKVDIENLGTTDVAAADYRVRVMVDNRQAGFANGLAIEAGQTATIVVPVTATNHMDEKSEIYAEIVYANDNAVENNRSKVAEISVKMPNLPEPENLLAANAGTGINLNWTAAAAPRTADEQITEGFEDYDAFQRTTKPFGEWAIIDKDNRVTYSIKNYSFKKAGAPMAFIIFNPGQVRNETDGTMGMTQAMWQPRTGQQLAVSFSPAGEGNDWLISPELSGNPQTISFYAHQAETYVESFNVLYSTTGTDESNFVTLSSADKTEGTDWDKKYEYTLPMGAKYFAIQKVSNEAYAFMLDDVTFSPYELGAQTGAELAGYNVFRNGELINGALVSSTNFNDAEGKAGDVYYVTAVYNNGESGRSNYAQVVDETAVEDVSTGVETGATNDDAYDLQGRRVSRDYKGIVVTKGKKMIKR